MITLLSVALLSLSLISNVHGSVVSNSTSIPDQIANTMPDQEANTVPVQTANTMPDQEANTMPDQEANTMADQEANTMADQEANTMADQTANTMPDQTVSNVPDQAANTTDSPESQTAVYTERGPQLEERGDDIIFAKPGGNVTLPCRLIGQTPSLSFGGNGMRIKWTKASASGEEDVLVSMGLHKRAYSSFQNRVSLQESDDSDASLVIINLDKDDFGTYKCEVIDGMDDNLVEVTLAMEGEEPRADGVVFPYSPRLGRYNLNFHDAERACLEQDAVVASFDQLYEAWTNGLNWCNAGWLSDGSVQYPITTPREPCGGTNAGAGLRNYGQRDKSKSRYDVFCFASSLNGLFYWLVQPDRLTYDEAVQACQDDDAEIAKVGHIYAAWKLLGYDRCDAGWLADGSVRYPISNPRKNCSPTEAAVRMVGFPDKKHKLYGVYCFISAEK